MELVAYLHSEELCERLQQGETIDQNLDCQMFDLIAKSSDHAKSVLCIGLAAGVIAINASPIAAFAYTPEIASIQQLLARRGFKPGAIDGVKGRATTEAIIAAQTFYKLETDGVIGSRTLAALQADDYETDAPAVDVKYVQRLLRDRGFYGRAIDGINGSMTRKAIILSQKTYGLIADGVAGSLTIAALEAGSNYVQLDYQEPTNPVADSAILEGQKLLSSLGFYDGAIDGIQGSRTTAAIKEAQALYGLTVDGVMGSQTLIALRS